MTQFVVLDGDGDIVPVYKGEEMNEFQILTADEVRYILGCGGGPKHVYELTPAYRYQSESNIPCISDALCNDSTCSRLLHHEACPAFG